MKNMLIMALANYFIGSEVFNQIKSLVAEQESKLLSSLEKKNSVVAKLESIGVKTSASLINLGIELAVQYLKKK